MNKNEIQGAICNEQIQNGEIPIARKGFFF